MRHTSVTDYLGKGTVSKVDLLEEELKAKFEQQAKILDVRSKRFFSSSLSPLKCDLQFFFWFPEMVKQAILEAIQK